MSDSFSKPPAQSEELQDSVPPEKNPDNSSPAMKIRPVTRRRPSKTVIDYTPVPLDDLGARERKVHVRPEFSVKGTVSMRVVHEKSRCRGYPTLFRPEVGAVGGSIDEHPRTNPFVLLFVAIVTLCVANSAPMDKLVQVLQSERATAQASTWIPERHAPALFSPLFGPAAILDCATSCDARPESEIDACKNSCGKLSLSEFPKQATGTRSADEDAKQIIDSCLNSSFEKTRVTDDSPWQPALKTSLSTVTGIGEQKLGGDFANARLNLSQLTRLMGSLKFPPANTPTKKQEELTEKVLRASCLQAHLSLTSLARILTHQNSDENSEKYYSSLEALVRQPVNKLQAELKKEERVGAKSSKNS